MAKQYVDQGAEYYEARYCEQQIRTLAKKFAKPWRAGGSPARGVMPPGEVSGKSTMGSQIWLGPPPTSTVHAADVRPRSMAGFAQMLSSAGKAICSSGRYGYGVRDPVTSSNRLR